MKPTKTKNKLTGKEGLEGFVGELRTLANEIYPLLAPTTKINILRDEMQLAAREIQESMARSKIAMLASMDILRAGEDLLGYDFLCALDDERNSLVSDDGPESPGEDAGEPVESAESAEPVESVESVEPVEQHDVDSKHDEQTKHEVERIEKLLGAYRPDYQRVIIEKFSETLSEKEKDFAEEEARDNARDDLLNYMLNNTDSYSDEEKIYRRLLAQVKGKNSVMRLAKTA